MPVNIALRELESALTSRFGPAVRFREKPGLEVISTGIPAVDSIIGGIPRGAITEIFGSRSSGRTTLAVSILAEATTRQEICALVDCNDSLDPTSASAAGVDLNRLLWIRCAANIEHAFKATEFLLQGGGFGIVILDLGDVSPRHTRRIPSPFWFRFHHSIEATPTGLVVIDQEPQAQSCALALKMKCGNPEWKGYGAAGLLHGIRFQVERTKPVSPLEPVSCFFASSHYTTVKFCFSSNIFMPRVAVR
jgi:recA bacterial DNA recombination protein